MGPGNLPETLFCGLTGFRLYGMDAELELKNRDKRDPDFETKILTWLEKALELKLQDKANFAVHFQTGVLLLKLINVISPGHFPKIDTRDLHLVHHENVNMYLKACWELGVPSSDLFITSDLTRLKVTHFPTQGCTSRRSEHLLSYQTMREPPRVER
jgi:hypothetical protein